MPLPAQLFPNPASLRRFCRFIRDRQARNSGQPVILHPSEIERATGVSEAVQIGIRQQLMLAGRLRLSVVGNAWAYALAPAILEATHVAHPVE